MKTMRPARVLTLAIALAAGAVIAGSPDEPPGRIAVSDLVPSVDQSMLGTTPPTTPPPTTTTTVPASTTTAPATTTTTTATTVVTIDDRATVTVIVANATGVESVAGVFRDRIKPLGYVEVFATVARDPAVGTTIYCLTGFEDEGRRLAADVGLGLDRVIVVGAPAEAPGYYLERPFELLVVIGAKA